MRVFLGRRHYITVNYFQRRLPDWRPDGKVLFVTWHLHGSLPDDRIHAAEARLGPSWLRRAKLARTVVETLRYAAGTLGYFELHAYVVMPNHVHVLLLPLVDPGALLRSVRGFSAREANKRLGRRSGRFWHRQSYDHWIGSETECEWVRRYIEESPVRAGLAAKAEEYPWSSAYSGMTD